MFSPPSMFNFSEVKTPTRNKPIVLAMPKSPFCTSPSQLEEVTNDEFNLNLRTSREPFGGRSIKEVEDHLNNLRKENFNLKLRIFFLEENLGPGFNNEETLKTNVNLKIEIEGLKKELQVKTELLCQAVKAIEVEEEEHKRFSEEKKLEMDELQQRLDALQRRPHHLHGDALDFGSDEETMELISENERLRVDLQHKEAMNIDLLTSVEKYKSQTVKQSLEIEEYKTLLEVKDAKISTLESTQKKLTKSENGDAETQSALRSPLRSVPSPNGPNLEKIAKLEQEQLKACKIIKTMLEARKKSQAEAEELKKTVLRKDQEILELKEKMKGVGRKSKSTSGRRPPSESSSDVEQTMEDETIREDHEELLEQYKALTQELDIQKQILLDTLKDKDAQMKALQEKYSSALEDLKQRDNQIVDLEFELIGKESREKSDSGTEKEERDREIERLEKELSRKTCDLQTVVNKELWEKNREIEKLQKKLTTLVDVKETEVEHLKAEFNKKEEDLMWRLGDLEARYEKEVSMLHTNLKCFVDDRKKLLTQIEEYKATFANSEEKLLKCENLRLESNEICGVLSTRLEEMALFLDSLLRQKSVLGYLGNKQNERLKQFIDQSLDLSRSLNASLNMNPDESLMQLTNISELLNSTKADSLCIEQLLGKDNNEEDAHLSIIPGNITLTYQNHLNVKNADKMAEQAEIIKVLRNQVDNLKHEIEVRDNEIANKVTQISDLESRTRVVSPERILETLMSDKLKFNNATQKSHESDSECWSEPDRSVSKARIGLLDNDSLKPKMKSCTKSESTELEFSMKLSKASKKSSLGMIQHIVELQEKLRIKEDELSSLQHLHSDLIEKYDALEYKYNEDKVKFNEIISSHEVFLRKIREIEESLNQAEDRRQVAEDQVIHLKKLVTELEENKRNLVESVEVKSKDVQDRVNVLEVEKDKAIKAKEVAMEELKVAKDQIKMAENRALAIEKELLELQKVSEGKIKEMEVDYESKIKQIECNAESRIQVITKSSDELLKKYETDYVKKNEMDRLVNMVSELETLQEVLKVSETRITGLEESESSLKTKLQETEVHYREKVAEMRKELDTANLHYSEVVLQKTNVEEEKMKLEYEMKVYTEKEEEFVRQVVELKEEFGNLREKFHKQMTSMEDQKSKLLVRISELETSNADLLNKLIRRVSGYEDFNHVKSAPNSPTSKILNMYLSRSPETNARKHSDASTGFISESHTVAFVNYRNASGGDDGNMDMERQHANSSPDLGIESDHGRFSSLEANINVPRPYLHSLELSHSMNELLDREQSQLVECRNQHCCNQAEENTQLRKKLQKSNKLLEETIKKLARANERKREVERNICNQITKTSLVLKKAKANLDSGSECDFRK